MPLTTSLCPPPPARLHGASNKLVVRSCLPSAEARHSPAPLHRFPGPSTNDARHSSLRCTQAQFYSPHFFSARQGGAMSLRNGRMSRICTASHGNNSSRNLRVGRCGSPEVNLPAPQIQQRCISRRKEGPATTCTVSDVSQNVGTDQSKNNLTLQGYGLPGTALLQVPSSLDGHGRRESDSNNRHRTNESAQDSAVRGGEENSTAVQPASDESVTHGSGSDSESGNKCDVLADGDADVPIWSGLEGLLSVPTSRRLILSSAGASLAAALANRAVPNFDTWDFERASAALAEQAEDPPEPDLLSSPALASLASRVSTFTLPNGMQWIVLERHTAPIISCHTFANVGASDEKDGVTGVAHLLEHLAFKGTPLVGTNDYAREAVLLDQLDEAFYDLRDSRDSGAPQDKLSALQEKFEKLKASAAELSVPNEYGSLLSREGGVGLNAVTSQDSTEYYVSLPANKLELWMALESARFLSPVFRELYSEKEVVKEERRLRIDNSPYGRITEEFSSRAFPSEPYGRPTIGFPSDLERMGRREVEDFFSDHYTPRSLCCAVVGDVDPARVEALALKYFGQWSAPEDAIPAAPWGPTWRTSDGWDSVYAMAPGAATPALGQVANAGVPFPQPAFRAQDMRVAVNANPLYMEGYLRPGASSLDDPALSVLSLLLSGLRSSRFYKNLILPGRVLSASASESFPGDKYPSLFLVSAFPSLGSSPDMAAREVRGQLRALAETGPSREEMGRVRKALQVGFLQMLGSNGAMAGALCGFNARCGTWRGLLDEKRSIVQVSQEDVQRVAGKLFQQSPHFTLFANRA